MFEVLNTDGRARRGLFSCPHGTVQTPVFMNVGTQGAIKGALSAEDLSDIGCQIELSNTYHLHVRPGDELIRDLGGLHRFMTWRGPILTDSGGFQIFSLAQLRRSARTGSASIRMWTAGISSWGRRKACGFSPIWAPMSPWPSTSASKSLALSVCQGFLRTGLPAGFVRCKAALDQYNGEDGAINPGQVLFGINQGAIFHDLRIEHMKTIAELDLAGYAIGGLAVGESAQEMYDTIEAVEEHMPKNRPRYLMGVGTPGNIIEGVCRGVDFFDWRDARAPHGRQRSFHSLGTNLNIRMNIKG